MENQVPSLHIAFRNGTPTMEEKQNIEQALKDNFGFGIFVTWSQPNEEIPVIKKID